MHKPIRISSLCLALVPAFLFLTPLKALAYESPSYYYKGETPAPVQQVKELHDGIYIGLAGGYDSYRVRSNTVASFNGDTISANPPYNATGFVGGLFGGYGFYLKKIIYLGAEAFVNISGATANTTFGDSVANSIYNNKATVGTSYGLSVVPGIKVNDSSLIYIRLGGALADIKSQESFTRNSLNASSTTTTWVRGRIYGLGMETAVYKNFSLRSEYVRSEYNDTSFTPLGTQYNSVDNQFMAGIIYHIY